MTMREQVLVLIPARMGSSRFPGKPMAPLLGKPMIGHVYERVSRAAGVALTAVATCDQEIADYIEGLGGCAVMTGSQHERASDRCAEALKSLEERQQRRFDIVVMVQGDEPMTRPEMVTEAVAPMLTDPSLKVVNLMAPIDSREEFEDPNCIKVVCDRDNDALYFSRQPIPSMKHGGRVALHKQVCVIPFRRDFLLTYTGLEPTPLELAESVDMMRVLEHGYTLRMVPTRFRTRAVDTPADLKMVAALMAAEQA
jgi:3-deoxy-manno-octulosonate cytidylyltransferase (CMP-KDO synthetase)